MTLSIRLRGICVAAALGVIAATTTAFAFDTEQPCTTIGRGDLARTRSFWHEALYRFEQAANAEPQNGRAWFYLGWSQATIGRYGDGAASYLRAAEAGYAPALARFQAARSFARAGLADEAFDALAGAVRSGFVQFEKMHNDGALRTLHDDPRWAGLMPAFEPAFVPAYRRHRDGEADALEALRRVVDRFPASGKARLYLGLEQLRAGAYADAETNFVRAGELGFESPYAFFDAARAAGAGGDVDRAFELLERALEHGFMDASALAEDAHLAPLRNDRRYGPLVAGIGLAAAPPFDDAWLAPQAEYPGERWRLSTPAAEGLDAAVLEAGVRYILETRPETNSLVVVRNGRIAFERYFNGYDAQTATNVKSSSKAMITAALGAAIADGAIEGVGASAQSLLPRVFAGATDPRAGDVTLRHLATMTSGLRFAENSGSQIDWFRSDDWSRYYLDAGFEHDPGEVWNYSTASYHMLAEAIARATREHLATYTQRRVLGRIGARIDEWTCDPNGNAFGGSNVFMTPRDMARFGLLILSGGEWDGERVLPRDWVIESTRPYDAPSIAEGDVEAYGYGWWRWSAGRYVSFLAAGHGGQNICVTPELGLVIVTTGDVHRPNTPPMGSMFTAYVMRAVEAFARDD